MLDDKQIFIIKNTNPIIVGEVETLTFHLETIEFDTVEEAREVKKQILHDQEDAEKLKQYQKENWISIPKADFETMRKEEKESRVIVEQLKKEYEATKSLNNEGDPFLLSRPQYEDILWHILTTSTKEG